MASICPPLFIPTYSRRNFRSPYPKHHFHIQNPLVLSKFLLIATVTPFYTSPQTYLNAYLPIIQPFALYNTPPSAYSYSLIEISNFYFFRLFSLLFSLPFFFCIHNKNFQAGLTGKSTFSHVSPSVKLILLAIGPTTNTLLA